MRLRGWAFSVACVVFAGCAAPSLGGSDNAALPPPNKPVVIAVLDTGTNPYLNIFRSELHDPSALAVDTTALSIDLDDSKSILERAEAEFPMFESLDENQLYYFEDTRLLAISFESFDAPPTRDGRGHGAKTTYLAARESPDAWILIVQVDAGACIGPDETDCHIDSSVAEGMEWIADQPWIDVVSVSIGFPADAPDPGDVYPEARRFLSASERAARDGKVMVFAAGNDPSPSLTEYFAGPPWVIAVSGGEGANAGTNAHSAKVADVVANATEQAPGVLTEELETRTGTSFATPIVAGTIATSLATIRETKPTFNDTLALRAALNATARYFEPTAWDPVPACQSEPLNCPYMITTPALLQAQMGWGYIDGGMAPEIARRVLENDLAPPPEKQQAILFQAQWQQAREEYWSTAPR